MKRLLCVLLLILFLGCYCSCKADINERYDLEEFGIYDFEHSICRSLLPRSFINEKGHFQKAYDYTDGAYYFDLSALFDFPVFERVLVWMEFDDENYELAKIEKQCQQNVFIDCHTTIEKYTIRLDKLVKEQAK